MTFSQKLPLYSNETNKEIGFLLKDSFYKNVYYTLDLENSGTSHILTFESEFSDEKIKDIAEEYYNTHLKSKNNDDILRQKFYKIPFVKKETLENLENQNTLSVPIEVIENYDNFVWVYFESDFLQITSEIQIEDESDQQSYKRKVRYLEIYPTKIPVDKSLLSVHKTEDILKKSLLESKDLHFIFDKHIEKYLSEKVTEKSYDGFTFQEITDIITGFFIENPDIRNVFAENPTYLIKDGFLHKENPPYFIEFYYEETVKSEKKQKFIYFLQKINKSLESFQKTPEENINTLDKDHFTISLWNKDNKPRKLYSLCKNNSISGHQKIRSKKMLKKYLDFHTKK